MDGTGADSIISVYKSEHSPLWCHTLDGYGYGYGYGYGCMDNFLLSDVKNKRSQYFLVYYALNGAVYLATVEKFIEYKSFIMKNSRALIMARERSVDIGCEHDFEYACFLMNKRIVQGIN